MCEKCREPGLLQELEAAREKLRRLTHEVVKTQRIIERGRMWGGMGWKYQHRLLELAHDNLTAALEGE